jgi:hypothetical protein
MRHLLLFLLVVVPGLLLAQPNPIKPISVTASSFMAGKTNYPASNVADADLKTWWTPAPPASNGSGAWLQLNFDNRFLVEAVAIHPGSHYPNYPNVGNIFGMNLRLRQAKLTFDDGSSEEITLEDKDETQVIQLKASHLTRTVKLTPKAVYSASKWQDLCISHFEARGERFEEGTQNNVGDSGEGNTGPEQDFSHQIGIYLNPNEPCAPTASYLLPKKDGNYEAGVIYTMDGISGTVRRTAYDPDGRLYITLSNGLGSEPSEDDQEMIIPANPINLCEDFPELCTEAASADNPFMVVEKIYTLHVLSNYIGGTWQNQAGMEFEFFEDHFTILSAQQKESITCTILPPWGALAPGCFFIQYEDLQGTKLLSFEQVDGGVEARLVFQSDDSPDAYLSEEPIWILTPSR